MNKDDGSNIIKAPRNVGYYITKYLKKHGAEVEILPPEVTGLFPYRVKHALYKYMLNKESRVVLEPALVKREAKIRSEIINKSGADFIFSFGPLASAFLETDIKTAFWVDACFAGLIDYHPAFYKFTKATVRNGHEVEQRGLSRATAAFYTSDWARNGTIKNYNVDEKKLIIAPFGANIDFDHELNFIEKLINERINNKVCKFLLVGVNWQWKGADIAVDIVKRLNNQGFKSELVVIGCEPPENHILPEYVKNIRFVNKETKDGLTAFIQNFSEAHFFLMPTLSVAFGHVFCEANAFGLPCISHKTGGIPSVIHNGKNGQLFEIGEDIDNWCNYIIDTFNNKAKYYELCLSSFNEYQTRLNWDVGTKIVYDKLSELL